MRRTLLLIVLCTFYLQLFAQSDWKAIDNSLNNIVQGLIYNPETGEIALVGNFSRSDDLILDGVTMWNGEEYLSLEEGIKGCSEFGCANPISQGVFYKGELIIGLRSDYFQDVLMNGITRWDGESWHPLGQGLEFSEEFGGFPGDATGIKVIEDTLYVGGYFQKAGGKEIEMIAKWDGAEWHGLGFPGTYTADDSDFIMDIIRFEGDLYVAGNFSLKSPDGDYWVDDIAKFDGKNWMPVADNTYSGALGDIKDLIEYKGKLYAGGLIYGSENPGLGNGLIRLNGDSWESVDGGIGNPNNHIWEMLVYKDLLFVFGRFQSIAGQPASSMAIYDGEEWFIPKGDFGVKAITSGVVIDDELYITGSFKEVDGEEIKYFAKWDCLQDLKSCGILVNAKSTEIQEQPISIFPNPAEDYLIVKGVEVENYEILTIDGRMIRSCQSESREIDVADLPRGLYWLKLNGHAYGKFVKK